jgi:hypothetical protein
MKKLYTLLALVAFSASVNAQTTITQWDFDASNLTPTIGSGTITIIGGVEENIQTGTGACNCPFVAGNPSTGKAYSIKTFPLAGTATGTAGFQFSLSTVGYSGLTLTFDPRGSGTSSKWQQYEYTTDGSTWNVIGNNGGALVNSFGTTPISVTLPAACDNQSGFGFRIVSIFDPAGSDYASVTGGATAYSAAGAWRVDNVKFSGNTLSVNQNAIAGLDIYPNPVTNGVLNINTTANDTKNVVVYDVLGKQVVNTTISGSTVNVANLKNGVYIVKITENGKTATRKLVIR